MSEYVDVFEKSFWHIDSDKTYSSTQIWQLLKSCQISKTQKMIDQDIEMSTINDLSEDFLTEVEKDYYFNLKDTNCELIASVALPKANCQKLKII